jgi:mannose-6-phosphate isomerase
MTQPNWTLPHKLTCRIQSYAWGCTGPDAYLAQLMGLEHPESPLAELWMGAHTKIPSVLDGQGLDAHIKSNANSICGEACLRKFGMGLPYLFKILSARESLSIQLHPSKTEAEGLHAKDPKNYPDDNHKPEIAIALDSLEALLGFESLSRIVQHLDQEPELAEFLGAQHVQALRSALNLTTEKQNAILKAVFTALFELSQTQKKLLKSCTTKMAQRLRQKNDGAPRSKWFIELQQQYSEGDVGLFCLYFLKYCTLQPGEGVFLKADVPHAYLRGNIVECMANSDNVVRAGLTPKFVDVETLSQIVIVEQDSLNSQHSTDNGLGGGVFKVVVDEFEVHHWKNTQAQTVAIELSQLSGPRILVMLSGSLTSRDFCAQKGQVVLLADACKENMELSVGGEFYLARPNC